MFKKIKISIVKQKDKYEKAKLAKPNIIYNRFDIKYSGDFNVLKVTYKNTERYITFHISKKNACYIGIYMTELEQCVFDEIIKFLKMQYPDIDYFHITQGLIKNPALSDKMCWFIELPNTVEEYWAQFSSKTRSERRRKIRKLHEDYDVSFEHITKPDINEDLIKRFLEFKTETEENICYKTDESGVKLLLSDMYHITDACIIKINGKIEAIEMYSITSDEDVYFVNLAYNTDYSGIGMMAYYYAIEQLIEGGYKRIYLGGGNYKYKRESKAVKFETMSGNIKNRQSFAKKILKCIYEFKKEKNHKVFKILGIKLKKRIKSNKFSKSQLLRKFFINCNMKGSNNKIRAYYKNRWHKIKMKSPESRFWIKGDNNIVKFHFDTRILPKGLDMTINGSNNVLDIYKCPFKNTYIQIYRDKNTLEIKEQESAIANAHIYVSYGGSMFIGRNCELSNGDLELCVAGDYIEKHKMVIGDNTHIAKGTIIRTSDGQSLIDPETNLPTDPPEDVIIGNHVWIMSRCIILKGSHIPDGCAVAANSLVNKKFDEENLLLCGTPAKIMKQNIRWGPPYGKYMERLAKENKILKSSKGAN